jgi:hypothetical protein
MLAALLGSVIPGLIKLGDKVIVDKDKQLEYAYKTQELTFALLEKIVTMQTIPWVDGVVKLLFALIALARPLGTLWLTLKGIQLHVDGTLLPEVVHYAMDGAFGAWAIDRHFDKKKKEKQERLLDE